MTYNPDIHHRRSIRLKDYDYSHSGAYFVTVCAWKKECLFGEIKNGEMLLSEYGEIVMKCWDGLPDHYQNVQLDEFVIMPNHIHGIIVLNVGAGFKPARIAAAAQAAAAQAAAAQAAAAQAAAARIDKAPLAADAGDKNRAGLKPAPTKGHALPEIVRAFKTFSSRRINEARNTPGGPVWQRNYYERIIRDDRELHAIREYIRYNPLKWEEDDENSNVKGMGRFETSPYIKNG